MAEYDRGSGLWVETCYKCKTRFGMSSEVHQIAKDRREQFTWFCPNGHPQVYTSGESELTKMRRRAERAEQQAAYEADIRRQETKRAEREKRSAAAYKGAATRMKNRVKAGVCPCCNRTFQNLRRHMETQHPERDLTNVVELGQAS